MTMTVKDSFEAMAGRFRAERAQGVKAVIQYDITGPGGCTYHVDIADGQCAVREGGAAATPNLTLTMGAQDWLDMLAGKLQYLSSRLPVSLSVADCPALSGVAAGRGSLARHSRGARADS
jgi:putative sterol carrier protein